ncbi:MAG TPA: hypothetical protein VGM63_11810 [Mucilaginibacter sp.]
MALEFPINLKKGNLPRAIFSFHYRNICKFLQELIIADKELAYLHQLHKKHQKHP